MISLALKPRNPAIQTWVGYGSLIRAAGSQNSSVGAQTQLVAAFLEARSNVTLHFTPTYSSWLNQVELWFSKV